MATPTTGSGESVHEAAASSQPGIPLLACHINRWYEHGTGQYTRPDPLGLLEGEDHLYVYAQANPLAFTDSLGLTSYKNFPPDKEREARDAVSRLKRRLETERPCCVGNAPKLLRRLENATLVYREDLRHRGQPVCGFVNPWDWITRRIKIGGLAYQPRCGPLECTVLHEIVHLGIRNAGKGAAYRAEKDCFDCGTGKPPDA